MLVLKRELDQRVFIETPCGRLTIVVVDVRQSYVKLGFDCPANFHILRDDAKDVTPKGVKP